MDAGAAYPRLVGFPLLIDVKRELADAAQTSRRVASRLLSNSRRHARAHLAVLSLMRRASLLLFASLLAGCNAAPSGIRPTLDDVEALGFLCDVGIPDNVPSGLTQWHCRGTVRGHEVSVLVDGKDTGVAGFSLGIDSTDPAIARDEFRRLATGVAPLTAQPNLAGVLDAWSGAQDPKVVGGARVNGLCDATQCIVFIGSVDGPTNPLRLP